MPPGEAMWREAEEHPGENVGSTTFARFSSS